MGGKYNKQQSNSRRDKKDINEAKEIENIQKHINSILSSHQEQIDSIMLKINELVDKDDQCKENCT